MSRMKVVGMLSIPTGVARTTEGRKLKLVLESGGIMMIQGMLYYAPCTKMCLYFSKESIGEMPR